MTNSRTVGLYQHVLHKFLQLVYKYMARAHPCFVNAALFDWDCEGGIMGFCFFLRTMYNISLLTYLLTISHSINRQHSHRLTDYIDTTYEVSKYVSFTKELERQRWQMGLEFTSWRRHPAHLPHCRRSTSVSVHERNTCQTYKIHHHIFPITRNTPILTKINCRTIIHLTWAFNTQWHLYEEAYETGGARSCTIFGEPLYWLQPFIQWNVGVQLIYRVGWCEISTGIKTPNVNLTKLSVFYSDILKIISVNFCVNQLTEVKI